MKKIVVTFAALVGLVIFSQAQVKISLATGQKLVAVTNISMEASLSPGMDITSKSTSENTLEVKSNTDKNYTIASTLTKLKVNMEAMGQATNYDSEKKEDQETEIGKNFAVKLNKPEDIIIDNISGKDLTEKKKEKKADPEESNPAEGLLGMFSDNSNAATVTGAFELIPQGKKTGDSWSDSSNEKGSKILRTYTLKSVNNKEATIQLDVLMDATNTFELQGMSMEFTSTTKTTGEIITDISTGLVKKRDTKSDITGSIQVMGQAVPITAKATSTVIYQ